MAEKSLFIGCLMPIIVTVAKMPIIKSFGGTACGNSGASMTLNVVFFTQCMTAQVMMTTMTVGMREKTRIIMAVLSLEPEEHD
jgi:hypothetical protein